MNVYAAGLPVTLAQDFVELAVYEPVVSVQYRVLDQAGLVLLDFTTLDESSISETGVIVVVDQSLNQLGAQEKRALRMVELSITTARTTYRDTLEYVIEAEQVLVAGVNSFVSYGDAVMIGFDIPALTGWNNVDKSTRISALLFAKRMIGRLRFIDPITRKPVADLNDWASVPDGLKETLARAQVLEANEVCGGDPVTDYRRRGLQSITVGESKNFFQSWKPADDRVMEQLGISPATARELKPYLASPNVRIRRS